MVARVRVQGLPDRVLEGHVESVTQLPMKDQWTDIRYFIGHVVLEATPRGLRRGCRPRSRSRSRSGRAC